jgi:hypothetical protein
LSFWQTERDEGRVPGVCKVGASARDAARQQLGLRDLHGHHEVVREFVDGNQLPFKIQGRRIKTV